MKLITSINATQNSHSTPVLECEASSGKTKYWQGHVCVADGLVYTYTTYCQSKEESPELGDDPDWESLEGKDISVITISAPTKIEGKNLGRSNETSPLDQAIMEITSTYNKQLDKGYYPYGEDGDGELPLPMLAKKYDEYGHKIDWSKGVTIQPKFDGVRAVCDGTKMWSRKKKLFLSHVTTHILGTASDSYDLFSDGDSSKTSWDLEGHILDGELILPPPYPLQDTMSAISKKNSNSHKLLYRVYDVLGHPGAYPERYALAERLVKQSGNPQIILAPREVISDESEIFAIHKRYVAEGWEGSMIRNHTDGYKIRHRSASLLKLKDFFEDEFEVIDVVDEGTGKFVGVAMLVCLTPEGLPFKCTPIGTMARRRKMLEDKDKLIGTWWTIRYQTLTKEGKPQFGRAINQRDRDIQG